ncbi:MAG: hypothetical protein NTV94_13140, partial [Planctomycetota bacterium]|nr:hypothetical protein [Planctomycetota bacterium]
EDRLEALRENARAKMNSAEQAIIAASLSTERTSIEALKSVISRDRNTLKAEFLNDVAFDESAEPERIAMHLKRHRIEECGDLVTAIVSNVEKLERAQSSFRKSLANLKRTDAAWLAAEATLDAIPPNPEIEVPPRYASKDFQNAGYWRLRGKLDVPKERFVSFPHCGPDGDQSLLITWAGFDHRQQARALVNYFVERRDGGGGGWDSARFIPLLAGLLQLLPWRKQWHNAPDADGNNWADVIEAFVADEARDRGLTLEQIQAWTPPETTARKGRPGRKKKAAQLVADVGDDADEGKD